MLVNVSRGLSTPITLEPDHNDVLAARDSGFLQIHCSTCQEVLDTILMAYRLAKHKNIRLPIIVNLDGFYLSFTREPVEIPDQAAARQFVGAFDPGNIRFRASMPESQAVAVLGGSPYSYFRYETHLAMLEALNVYPEVAKEFNQQFGRYHGILECFQCEDADFVFFIMGCFATKAKDAVIKLREGGIKIGLIRPRLIRPFPAQAIASAVCGKLGIAVIDQNLSMGKGGILHAEITSGLHELEYVLKSSGIVCLFTIPAFKSSDYVDMLAKLLSELNTNRPDYFTSSNFPSLRRVVVYDPINPDNTNRPAMGFTVWQEVISATGQITLEQLNSMTAGLDRDDPINIQYTSGTTGFPKPVLLSHHNLLNNGWFSAQSMHFKYDDRLCIPVPFYH